MKKTWKKIISVSCAALMAMSFASCGESAYELAVKNGFMGTEKEWLASLQGANGNDAQDLDINEMYEAAKAKGFSGSFMEFLKELGITYNADNNTEQIAKNAMSVVSIASGFKKKKTDTSTEVPYPAPGGSGVIIELNEENGSAIIVTNYHVVHSIDYDDDNGDDISDNIWVYPYGSLVGYDSEQGRDIGPDGIKASFIGGAIDYDIALLSVQFDLTKNVGISEAVLGDSEDVQIGEKVYAVGNPGGDGIAVTDGILSVTSETIIMEALDGGNEPMKIRVMRTDAPINPGNSGGALYNAQGELIGIVNAKSISSTVDNVGYAIPINLAKAVWENIQDNGNTFKRAMMGVTVSISDSSATMENGRITITETIVVAEDVAFGSFSYGKFLKDDIITGATIVRANGGTNTYEFQRQYHMLEMMLSIRKGDVLTIKINRNGQNKDAKFDFNKDDYFLVG